MALADASALAFCLDSKLRLTSDGLAVVLSATNMGLNGRAGVFSSLLKCLCIRELPCPNAKAVFRVCFRDMCDEE